MQIPEKEMHTDYQKRINKVFHFISENLDGDLSLETISKVASFSPFHFHRIFKTVTDETLNEYVTRLRIEKAASVLIHRRNVSITELSQQYGFNNNSSFTRAFKKFYGVSPSAFREEHPHTFSKIRQLKSKNGQAYPDYEKYICVIDNLKTWVRMNAKIEVKTAPKLNLAYISSIGSHNLEAAFEKLIKWATPKGLMQVEGVKLATIYHDSFKITAPDKVRMSASIILDETTEVNGEVGLTSIEEGKCIVGSFEIGIDAFEKSWTGLFLWMNENGYKKADRNPFEIYRNDFREHPERKCIVDFYIPVE